MNYKKRLGKELRIVEKAIKKLNKIEIQGARTRTAISNLVIEANELLRLLDNCRTQDTKLKRAAVQNFWEAIR